MTRGVLYRVIIHDSSQCCTVLRFYTARINGVPLVAARSCAVPRCSPPFLTEARMYQVVKNRSEKAK